MSCNLIFSCQPNTSLPWLTPNSMLSEPLSGPAGPSAGPPALQVPATATVSTKLTATQPLPSKHLVHPWSVLLQSRLTQRLLDLIRSSATLISPPIQYTHEPGDHQHRTLTIQLQFLLHICFHVALEPGHNDQVRKTCQTITVIP